MLLNAASTTMLVRTRLTTLFSTTSLLEAAVLFLSLFTDSIIVYSPFPMGLRILSTAGWAVGPDSKVRGESFR